MGVVRLRRAEPVTENELKSELKRCFRMGDIMSTKPTKPTKPTKTKKLLLSKVDKAHVRATKALKRARQIALLPFTVTA